MARRSLARTAVAAAFAVLLTSASVGSAAVAAPSTESDGVAAVIADYQARIPKLMAREQIPGLVESRRRLPIAFCHSLRVESVRPPPRRVRQHF